MPVPDFKIISNNKMLKLASLLIFAVSTTVLCVDEDLKETIGRQICLLAQGANLSDDPVNVLNTHCKPNCDFDTKQITFVCKNYDRKFWLPKIKDIMLVNNHCFIYRWKFLRCS